MAVWISAGQKLDICREVWETDTLLFESAFGTAPQKYLKCPGGICPLDRFSSWEEVASKCAWRDPTGDSDVRAVVEKLHGQVGAWFIGVAAIYQLVFAVHDERFAVKDQYDYRVLETVLEEYGKMVCPSTQITPDKFLERWGRVGSGYRDKARRFESASEAFKYLARDWGDKTEVAKELHQKKYFGEGRRCYYGWRLGKVLTLTGAEELCNRGLILTRKHVDILVECFARLANTYNFLATEYPEGCERARVIADQVERTIIAGYKAGAANANIACKAFHKARGYVQMRLLRNINRVAMEVELDDYKRSGLTAIADPDELYERASKLPPSQAWNVLHAYKWMPPPDQDATADFPAYHKYHNSHRKSGLDDDSTEEMRERWQRVVDERKMNVAVAYHSLNKEWPPGLIVRGSGPSMEALREWEPRSLFLYYRYGKDVVAQVKDKATVSASRNKEYEKSRRSQSESYLLWYLENSGSVDTITNLRELADGVLGEDNFVRGAPKAEAGKDVSRVFFLAPPIQRTLLGELEGNCAKIAAQYPGSLQGKSAADKARVCQKVMDVYENPPGTDTSENYEVYVITFDLSKFSPRSNPAVNREYHEFWAQVFGVPEIKALADVGCTSEIIYTHGGLKMHYKNPGCDLEGFRGRMMTMFHADMLGASARLAKEKGYLASKGVLAVFIDDGVIKVAVRGEGKESEMNAQGFLQCMREIYAACGQDNNPSKTMISALGGEMLADVYVNSVKVPIPIKAAAKLLPDYENPACAITEEFDSYFATSQGCVKDGGDWVATYRRYVEACCKAVLRWARRECENVPALKMALKLLTPKSFGGFGLQPLQCLVSTAGVNLTAEGLGMLNRAGRYWPHLRREIEIIIRRPVVERDPLSVLRDPERVRTDTRVLVENRLTMRIVRWLEERVGESGHFLAQFRNVDLVNHARAVAAAILSQPVISLPLLDRAWKSTPLQFVESLVGKFKRAGSIIALIGRREVGLIRRRNQDDVRAVLKADY